MAQATAESTLATTPCVCVCPSDVSDSLRPHGP